jgi:hypothetical protein
VKISLDKRWFTEFMGSRFPLQRGKRVNEDKKPFLRLQEPWLHRRISPPDWVFLVFEAFPTSKVLPGPFCAARAARPNFSLFTGSDRKYVQ